MGIFSLHVCVMCWDSNSGLLEEQTVILTVDPSLQLLHSSLWMSNGTEPAVPSCPEEDCSHPMISKPEMGWSKILPNTHNFYHTDAKSERSGESSHSLPRLLIWTSSTVPLCAPLLCEQTAQCLHCVHAFTKTSRAALWPLFYQLVPNGRRGSPDLLPRGHRTKIPLCFLWTVFSPYAF